MEKIVAYIQTVMLHKKTFLTSFVFVFIFTTLQYFGVKPSSFFHSPLPQTEDLFTAHVLPRLQQIPPDTFSLIRKQSFIPSAQASEPYDSAKAYVAIDFTTGGILAEKDMQEKLPIASLTKLMSAVVSLDLSRPDESFRVSKTASSIIPTKIGVIPGQTLTLQELLEAALMTSANDAVQVIKEGTNEKYHAPVFIDPAFLIFGCSFCCVCPNLGHKRHSFDTQA